ncbi:MAG: condensation domain-containing protein [Pseudomonadales bacterium]
MNQLSEKIEAVFPLSPTQAGMLYHAVSSPGSATYIGQHRMRLIDVDSSALHKAWQLVIERHSALRTTYVWEGLSQSVQLVHAQLEAEIEEIEFSGNEEQLAAFCEAERCIEFEFDKQAPSRLKLLRLNETDSELLWTRHHLMVDGWSAHAVLSELAQAYTAVLKNSAWRPSPVDGFASYIAWLQQQDGEKSHQYWHTLLSTPRSTSDLEGIRSANRGAHRTEQIERLLTEELSEQLRTCCRKSGLTLSALMHGAWSAVLAGFNNDSALVFGSTVSGRPADLVNADSIVGNFINTLPVMINTCSDMSLTDFLKALQLQVASSSAHSHIPHRDILASAAHEPGAPLFESILVFMNYPKLEEGGSALNVAQHEYKEHSHYPVAALIVPDDAIKIILIHDTGIIEPFKAQSLMQAIEKNLLRMLDMLEKPAREFFSSARSHTSTLSKTELTIAAVDVISQFEKSVREHPHSTALSDGRRAISYAELGNAAGNLARQLRNAGVEPEDRVLIRMPRTIEGLVAVWGVLYAGATYVPCNAKETAPRLQELADATQARCIIATEGISDFPDALVFDQIDTIDCNFQHAAPDPDALAYIIFTSGSTGAAKQVPVSHGNLAHSLAARLQFYKQSPKVYGLLSPLAFDSSVAGIFWMAATAGQLLLISESEVLEPQTLVHKLIAQNVEAMLCLPSVYSAVMSAWPENPVHSLQLAIVAGEACPTAVLEEHQTRFPAATLVNEYGPTEASVWCTAQRYNNGDSVDLSSDYLSIGHAIPGVSLSVRNDHGEVPAGTVGQLYVSGPTVVTSVASPGCDYATGDLVEQQHDGSLLFRGRIDQQVKIRGHRVDPSDIEASLHRCECVDDCAVLALPHNNDATLNEIDRALSLLSPLESNELLQLVENYNAPT